MTKKNWVLILFTVVLAVVYVVWFADWWRAEPLRISHTNRDLRPGQPRGNALPSLKFAINGARRFKEIKVVPLAEYETNKETLAVWHLISDSNSVPLRSFFYGQPIGGMHSYTGARVQALQTNVVYRMFLSTGKTSAQHDFEVQ